MYQDTSAEIRSLTATELKAAYPQEYNCWRNMKQRAKGRGALVSTEFDTFRDFLRSVGPAPSAEHTIDRIDNADTEYAPDKVRWASKFVQTNNRRNTVTIKHEGRTYSASEIAASTGTPIETIRRRINKGWSFHDVQHGRSRSNRLKEIRKRRSLYIREDLWPWLSPDRAEMWENEWQDEKPAMSRFDFFEERISRALDDDEGKLELYRTITSASSFDKRHDRHVVAAIEAFEHFYPAENSTRVSGKDIQRLENRIARRRRILEKLSEYERFHGDFHVVPRWHLDGYC